MAKIFLIDVSKCSGCYNCQLACKDEHCGNDWTPYAAPQPLTGQFWCSVSEHVQGTIPKVKMHYIAKMCAHCENPACMAACAENAIEKRDDGLVIIKPEKCTGCGKCVDECPIGVIYYNNDRQIAQKCTGCAHLLDNGYAQPRCSEACPTDAMIFGEEEALRERLADAKPLIPGGRIYYKNIPGEFIGGTVYDPLEKEVVIGAKCTLTDEAGAVFETKTDGFGDFWFKNLPKTGVYSLEISADGFEVKRFEALKTDKSVNLDDIPLERAESI